MKAFDLLHRDVQKAIWDLGWKEFRFIQSECIKHLAKNLGQDVIISAPTSSGKTEAAFLPIISEARDLLNKGLPILYISPLKALINDQFSRINDLCRKMDVNITKWHGDASQTKKKKLLSRPSGILLITPESLESLLINREAQARRLFSALKFIVIDEVHAFSGFPRGDQLKSVINRIQGLNDIKCTKIALSATIGSMENISKWLGNETSKEIIDKESGKGIRGSIRVLKNSSVESELVNSLVNRSKNGKNLFFANAKRTLENLCLDTKESSTTPHLIDIHHGSLDKSQREQVEKKLKENPVYSVFCTNTLELGIDVGDIDEITLLSPPWSMASFIQKIGRSGRKDGKDISFNFSIEKIEVKKDSHPFDLINWPLVKSIALTELLLEGWCEEGIFLTPGYSTLVHQVLAYIAQKRAVCAKVIYEEIIIKSFDRKVCPEEFKAILETLATQEMITQEKTGEITLAPKGEKLTEDFDFLSVFYSPEEWTLVNNGSKIGSIPLSNMYKAGDNITLGGRLWRVDSVDYDAKRINVITSKGGNLPVFKGSGGVTHPKIHQKMLEILVSDLRYDYLYPESKNELFVSRDKYKELLKDPKFLPVFYGTKVTNTLWFALQTVDSSVLNFDFCLLLSNELENLGEVLHDFEALFEEGIVDNSKVLELAVDKYDYLLPDLLKIKSLQGQFFDFEKTYSFINRSSVLCSKSRKV